MDNSQKIFKINSIVSSIEGHLLIFATNVGYQVYTNTNDSICLLSFNKSVGALLLINLFYKSQIILFVGNSTQYPNNSLIFYDDLKKQKISEIKVKNGQILDFKLSKDIIYIFIKNTVLLFEFSTLTFIKKITDVFCFKNGTNFSISPNNDFVYIDVNYSDIIKISKFCLSKKNKIDMDSNNKLVYKQMVSKFKTTLSIIQTLKISRNLKCLIVVSFYGNKIHIYDLNSTELIKCIYFGCEKFAISEITLSLDDNFLCFVSVEKKKIILYNISDNNKNCSKYCKCYEHDDIDIIHKEINKENNAFTNFFGDIKKKILKNEKTKNYTSIDVNFAETIIYCEFRSNNQFFTIKNSGFTSKFIFNQENINEFLLKENKWIEFLKLK